MQESPHWQSSRPFCCYFQQDWSVVATFSCRELYGHFKRSHGCSLEGVCLQTFVKSIHSCIPSRKRAQDTGAGRGTIASMVFVFALVFLVVPWQVAFLGCWLIQLSTCASSEAGILVEEDSETTQLPQTRSRASENNKHNMYLLLLMTWLLPLAAPVLVVWVRTLAQVGLATPFDGDHFVPSVAPFLILVDYASWSAKPTFDRSEM